MSEPLVFVVMAVFRPDPAHLHAQMASIAGQSHTRHRLITVAADTASAALIRDTAAAAGLAAPVVVETDVPLDAVRAFEAGIAEALIQLDTLDDTPDAAARIALSDQDDIWHPERLAKGLAALDTAGAQLVHSDARLVEADGTTLRRASMFAFERRLRHPGLRDLLYRNTITGMTTLFRVELARLSLPFPPQSSVHYYHDLWLGLLASATGGVTLIKEPLVDYRQHAANAIGAVNREEGWLKGLRGGGAGKLSASMWARREAGPYALARYLAHSVKNRLDEGIADGRTPREQVQEARLWPYLQRVRGAGSHLWDALRLLLTGHAGLARIAAAFAMVSAGRSAYTLREALDTGLRDATEDFDKKLFSLAPGMPPAPLTSGANAPKNRAKRRPADWRKIADHRKEPGWTPDFTAPRPALTVLVPTLNPSEIFAGVDTALEIGLGIARRGFDVRFIATDLPLSSPGASRQFLLRRFSSTEAAARISLNCGVSATTLPAHPRDVFFATAWWTAHIAEKLNHDHPYEDKRFLYLIQDFEPNFYAWGPAFAGAMESYDFGFDAVFNTTYLRDWFAAQGYGFASDAAPAFRPAIDTARYASGQRSPRDPAAPRRLALYGRPEVPRNMYTTAIEALAQFIETEHLSPRDVELVSVGLVHEPVALPRDMVLKSLGKLPWEDYPDFLLETDLGLSLMYSPHPSHPPIEMAASGCQVVTNSFGAKDLSTLSPAIHSAAPTTPAIAAALSRAWHAGPVAPESRPIDLSPLGMSMESLIDTLAKGLEHRIGAE